MYDNLCACEHAHILLVNGFQSRVLVWNRLQVFLTITRVSS